MKELEMPGNYNITNLIKFILMVQKGFDEYIVRDKDTAVKLLGHSMLLDFQENVAGFLKGEQAKKEIEKMPEDVKKILHEIVKKTEDFFRDFYSLRKEYLNSSGEQ